MSTSSKTRARRACGTVDHTLCKAHECRELKCHKTLQKVKWSREEDERLKRLVAQHEGADWDLIADNFKRRTDIQCQQRWQKVLNPELVKGPWTKEEDQRVTELVQKYGPKSWSVIAKHLHGRIGKQCRERWHNHLNPEVKKSSWTHDEDLVIYEAHKRLGNRWAEISKLLPGRTDNSIKNHWNSTMRRKVEHEGYLQEVPPPRTCKGKAPIKRKTKPISPMGLLHSSHNHYLMTLPTKISGYPLVLLDGPYADSVPETSVFVPHTEGCCSWSSSLTEEGLSLVNSTLSCLGDQSMEVHPGASVYTADSPSKYLEVEASAVLSSLQTIPEFAETLELIDSDPVAWSEVASFSLKKVTSPLEQEAMPLPGDMQEVPSYHLDDSDPISDLSRSYMELMSASSPSVTRLSTPHSILKRGEMGERGEQSPFSEGHSSTSFLDNSDSSPRLTPVKALPFSPSQFFNVCGGEDLNLDDPALTSTPVCGHKRACTTTTPLHKDLTPKYHKDNTGFQTPKVRKAIMLPTPQTPTPFKTTTATQEKMHGPMKLMPQSLGYLEEDFKEVLREESGVEVLMHGDSDNDFCSWTQEMDTPSKRVRKFLTLEPWSKDCLSTQLCSQEHFNNVQVSVEWEAVVFGKTDDQLSMTEQARRYLPSHTGAPPCLPRGLVL